MLRFAIIIVASIIIINGVWILVNPIYTSQHGPSYMDVGSTPCPPCPPCATPPVRQQPNKSPQQSTRGKPNTSGGNAFVKAINSAFSLKLGEQSSQDSCAAKHASAEPVIRMAHAAFLAGDTCGGGRGEVWAGTPDPTAAARMWLNSASHAAIIRGASKLACGAGSVSAVCVAY